MTNLNPTAWKMLREDEKMALNLSIVHNKSTWEAGEVMKKSHYKYLEIKQRAQYFLKIFQNHLSIFDTLIPDYVSASDEVKDYFRLTMEERMAIPKVHEILNKKYGFTGNKERLKEISETMQKWAKSENAYNQTLFHLIKDFDRWNNFRILPIDQQEPSAFKRRAKNAMKKHIKYTCTMPDISVIFLKDFLEPKTKNHRGLIYFPFITQEKQTHILKVKEKAIKEITPFQLYLFKKEADAKEYIALVEEWNSKEKGERECKDGLKFWPKYREAIKKAINYEAIQNITPTRRYLELAMEKLQFM